MKKADSAPKLLFESPDELRSSDTELPFDLSPDLEGESVPIVRSSPSLNRQFEASCASEPSKIHIPYLAASAVAPEKGYIDDI